MALHDGVPAPDPGAMRPVCANLVQRAASLGQTGSRPAVERMPRQPAKEGFALNVFPTLTERGILTTPMRAETPRIRQLTFQLEHARCVLTRRALAAEATVPSHLLSRRPLGKSQSNLPAA